MYSYNARFVEAIDGDTLLLYIDLGFYIWTMAAIRLTGVDFPEQPASHDLKREEQAVKFIENIFSSSDSLVIETHKQEDGSIVCDVIHEGKTLNLELERRGLLRGSARLAGLAH